MIRDCPACGCPATSKDRFCSGCGDWLPLAVAVPFTEGQRVRIIAGPCAGALGEVWSTWRYGTLAGRLSVRIRGGIYVLCAVQDVALAMDDGSPVTLADQVTWPTQWEARL